MHTFAFGLLFVGGVLSHAASQAPAVYQRPTTVTIVISGVPGDRTGSYEMKAPSSICGEIPKEASLTGEAVFIVEFPSDMPAGGRITSVAFSSNQLVAGVKRSTRFRLTAGIVRADGGKPALYVLNTDSGQPKNVGGATLAATKGTVTLMVTGQNDLGETVELTVSCE